MAVATSVAGVDGSGGGVGSTWRRRRRLGLVCGDLREEESLWWAKEWDSSAMACDWEERTAAVEGFSGRTMEYPSSHPPMSCAMICHTIVPAITPPFLASFELAKMDMMLNCLPLISIYMDGGEVNLRNKVVANEISSHLITRVELLPVRH
nr:hypothetical protein Iba_chr07bCG11250 [Ipomoea batatas]